MSIENNNNLFRFLCIMEIEMAIFLMLALSLMGGLIPFLMTYMYLRGEDEPDKEFRSRIMVLINIMFTPVIYALLIGNLVYSGKDGVYHISETQDTILHSLIVIMGAGAIVPGITKGLILRHKIQHLKGHHSYFGKMMTLVSLPETALIFGLILSIKILQGTGYVGGGVVIGEITPGSADIILLSSIVFVVLSIPIFFCYRFLVMLGDERSFLYRIPMIVKMKDIIDKDTQAEKPGVNEFDRTGEDRVKVVEGIQPEDGMDPVSRMFGMEIITASLGMVPSLIGFTIAIILLTGEGFL